MEIEFCECGGIMEHGKGTMKCRSCGKEVKKDVSGKFTTQSNREEVVVIENNKPDTLPTTIKTCPKCNHNVAYWWLIQTRSSDEPPTQFYRCEKCKHTWREYK
jgi:DNA-directed RNA polymerase subunit M